MSNINYLPLGSVVVLQGGTQRVIIVSRAVNVNDNGEQFFFDYGGVPYPDGVVSEKVAYFNHDAIDRVFFEGYRDDDEAIMNDRINEYVNENPNLKRKQY